MSQAPYNGGQDDLPTDRESLLALRIEVVNRYMGVLRSIEQESDPQTLLLLDRVANDLLADLAQIDRALARLLQALPDHVASDFADLNALNQATNAHGEALARIPRPATEDDQLLIEAITAHLGNHRDIRLQMSAPTPEPPPEPPSGGLLGPVYNFLRDMWSGMVRDITTFDLDSRKQILAALNPVSGLATATWDLLDDPASLLYQRIQSETAGLRNQLIDVVATDIPRAISGAQEGIAGFLGKGLEVFFRSSGDLIGDVLGSAASSFLESIEGPLATALKPLLSRLRETEDMPPELDDILAGLESPTQQWQALILGGLMGGTVGSLLQNTARGFMAPLQWAVNRRYLPQLVGQDDLVMLHYRYPQDRPDWLHEFANLGVSSTKVDLLLRARQRLAGYNNVQNAVNYGLMSPVEGVGELEAQGYMSPMSQYLIALRRQLLQRNDLQDMVNRNLVPEDYALDILNKWGYTDDDAKHYMALRFYLPNVQDVVRFAVREAYRDDIARQFGTDEDFEKIRMSDATRIGLAEEEVKKYWRAHWELPSVTMSFDMYHRTTKTSTDPDADTFTLPDGSQVQNVIGLKTMDTLLRVQDYMPFWRDKMIAVAYTPFTRVDIRRLYRTGVFLLPDVVRSYLDIGYSPDNALIQAQFVDALDRETHYNRALPQIREQAKLGILEGDALLSALTKFANDSSTAVEAVELLDLDIRGDRVGQLLTAYRQALHAGHISPDQFRQELATLGVSQALADHFITVERVRTTDYEAAEDVSTLKAAGRGSVVRRFREGLTDEITFRQEMASLGYSTPETDRYLDIARLDFDTNWKLDLVNAALTAFRKGRILLDGLSSRLDDLGIVPALRDAYLEREISRIRLEDPDADDVNLRASGASVAVRRYKEGWDSREDLALNLAALAYSEREIERYRIIADLEFDYDWKMDILAGYRQAYKAGDIDAQFLTDDLTAHGMVPSKVQSHLAALSVAQRFAALEAAREAAAAGATP